MTIAAVPVPSGSNDAAAGGTILVAEDNPVSRELLKFQLDLLGYSVIAVEDGSKALKAWREFDIAMLVTDVQMPGLGGYELAAAIRAEPPGVNMPIVVLTAGEDDERSAHKAREGLVDAVLVKPITLAALRSTLAHWLPRTSDESLVPGSGPGRPRPLG